VVRRADVLVGGRALLASLSGHDAEKLPVGADTAKLALIIKANREAGKRQVVLCSGDPLFFGLGARLAELLDPDALRFVPAPSSLQGAAAFLGLPWENIRAVSLHGRLCMLPLAHALMAGKTVFALTDKRRGPAEVAAWMLERGYAHYVLHVLEELRLEPGLGVACGRHCRLNPEEAARAAFDAVSPRVLLLVPQTQRQRRFGLGDEELSHEKELFTKLPVRATALGLLGIAPEHVVWDLGAGSGAVALEAAFLAHRGQVVAVERHERRIGDIRKNRARHGAANLEIVEGRMPECLADVLPRPDRIFLGGGLGDAQKAGQTLDLAWRALKPGGRIVAACVLLSSLELARSAFAARGGRVSVTSLQAGVSAPLARDTRLQAQNPVFLVLAHKPEESGE
jgi:precorrin-6Y C5,15-methyltransferase (decarboxylating)